VAQQPVLQPDVLNVRAPKVRHDGRDAHMQTSIAEPADAPNCLRRSGLLDGQLVCTESDIAGKFD
jgi:hypothetical protein